MVATDLNSRVGRLDPSYRQMVYQAVAEEKAAKDFVRSVQDLPPELFNMAKDYTFTIESSTVKIVKGYKPPSILQVTSRSRYTLKLDYYSRTAFCVDDEELLLQWARSWDLVMRSSIKNIRFETRPDLRNPADDREATEQVSSIHSRLQDINMRAKMLWLVHSIYVNIRFPSDGREVWTWNPWGTFVARRDWEDGSRFEPPK